MATSYSYISLISGQNIDFGIHEENIELFFRHLSTIGTAFPGSEREYDVLLSFG